jgi:isopenicillin N synthase-like dioxygenase
MISLRESSRDMRAFSAGLGQSFERFGFAVVSDHGIDADLLEAAFDQTQKLFALPEASKRHYSIPGGRGQRGYTPFGIETAKGANRADLKEFWHVGRELEPADALAATMPPNLRVAELPDFNRATYALFKAMDTLGLKVLEAVAVHLCLPPHYFDAHVSRGNSILRLLHYPPVAPGAAGLRAGAHEDINVITLLVGAEEAGLQLLDRSGHWLDIAPPPGCVVVNIGDMLQRLTNHVLPSTTHRVVNPDPARAGIPRYSMPFFQHFASDFLIETLPSCIGPGRPNRYPNPITADAYLQQRLAEIKLL